VATKLKVPRGATFRKGWVWYDGADVVKPIASITKGFHTTITATAHGLPATDIPVALLDVGELNTLDSSGNPSFDTKNRILAHVLTPDTFSVEVDSSEFSDYVSGGYLVYRPPKDLTGFSARMQFRASASAADILLELTRVSGITLGGVEGTIDMVMTDTQTTNFPKNYGVWNMELIAPDDGDVTRFDEGTIELSADVNRPVS
jgi:hypothetical protein